MPMNEAGGYRRSNLTKEQQREAEASIYGLAPKHMSPQSQQLSNDDIERMKIIIAQHEAANGTGRAPKEFDLNKPEKLPYRHQEFPKMLYDHDARTYRTVQNAIEEKSALAAGWRTDAFLPEVAEETTLDAEEQAEVDRLDKIARRKKQARQTVAAE